MRLLPLRSCVLALGLPFAAFACGAATAPPAPVPTAPAPAAAVAPAGPVLGDADVAKVADAYLALLVELRPESASELGLHEGDDRLEDRSPAGQEKIIERELAMAKELDERFRRAELSKAARIDLKIVRSALVVDARLRKETKPWARRHDFYAEPMQALFLMTARDYAPAAERATKALARMEQIPAMLKAARAAVDRPPAIWVQVGIEAAGGAREFFDSMKPFLEGALPKEKARSNAALKAAKDAYADWKAFLEKEVKPKAEAEGASFASGRELFDWLLREQYFLKEDAEALLSVGVRVFGETLKALDEVAHRIDPEVPKEGGWQVVVKRIKGKHPTAAELLPAYRKEMARARKFLVDRDVVEMPPGDQCDVVETPPFQRSTVTAAYDQAPPFAAQTKGLFYVTPVDPKLPAAQREQMLRENDWGDIVDTVVHEAYPGHHLQLSFARLAPSRARKATGPSIFSEGWALYTEELMAELGYYKDEERMMQLVWTLVRAARVMIDIGLHTKGMTTEQAMRMLTDEVGLERPLAESEVKRYSMTPTQPLAYLIGREKLFALRERIKQRDGKAFSLKKFHREVLTRGTLAPSLLEEELF